MKSTHNKEKKTLLETQAAAERALKVRHKTRLIRPSWLLTLQTVAAFVMSHIPVWRLNDLVLRPLCELSTGTNRAADSRPEAVHRAEAASQRVHTEKRPSEKRTGKCSGQEETLEQINSTYSARTTWGESGFFISVCLDSRQPWWILGAGAGESADRHRNEERALTGAREQTTADGGPGINSHSPVLGRKETAGLFSHSPLDLKCRSDKLFCFVMTLFRTN